MGWKADGAKLSLSAMGEILFQGFLSLWELSFSFIFERFGKPDGHSAWIKLAAVPLFLVLTLPIAAAAFIMIYIIIGVVWAIVA